MKRFPILLLFTLFFLQCVKDDPLNFDGENCINGMPGFDPEQIPNTGEFQLVFFEDSRIDTSENGMINGDHIVAGDKLVFLYEYVKNDKPFIADDEFTQRILFEIPAGLDSFLISGESLQNSNAVYGNLCFCLNRGYFRIDKGCIKGEKINNRSWKVAMNISAQATQGTFSKMLSETFKLD